MAIETTSHLLNFYGTECPHCQRMRLLLDKLEIELGVVVDNVEVWHNEENTRLMESYDNDQACGGVPFFYNTKTKAWLCGEVTYKELLDWAA